MSAAEEEKLSISKDLIAKLIASYSLTFEDSERTMIEELRDDKASAALKTYDQRMSQDVEKFNNTPDKTKLHILRLLKKENRIEYKYDKHTCADILKKNGTSLRILITQMRRVKWFFHFTRNNPNHTKRFYFRLKAIVGLDKWHLVSPDVRQAWEDAANRFDMQFGLVRAWAMTPWVLETPQKNPDPAAQLKKEMEAFNQEKENLEREAEKWRDTEKLIKNHKVEHVDMKIEVEKEKAIAEAQIQIVNDALSSLKKIQDEWNQKQTRPKEEKI